MSEAKYSIQWTAPKKPPMVPPRVTFMRQRWAESDRKRDEGLTTPEDVERFDNLSYGKDPVWHRLDLYRPKGVEGKLPVIVSVHGGGYFYGTKETYQFYCMDLARRGFAVLNMNYRLAPEHHYPAPLEDVNSAMSWMVAHSAEFELDTDNVFMVGDSAGAQLVSQYAVICSNLIYAAHMEITPPKFRLGAVGLNCGMYDLAKETQPAMFKGVMKDYFGTDPQKYGEQLNVLDYIDANYPPAYLISAPNDFLASHLMPMAAKLTRCGVENQWKLYGTLQQKEVAHVFHVNLRLPEAKQANDDETAFFRAHLVQVQQ